MSKQDLDYTTQTLLGSTGLSYNPRNGYTYIGTDKQGRRVYADETKVKDNDISAGSKYTEAYKQSLIPFGVLSDDEASWLDKVAGTAQDAAFIETLSRTAENKDPKQFVNTVLQKYGSAIGKEITSDPQEQAGLNAGLVAYNLYNNWNNLSGAQKSLGIANVGIQANKALTGLNLAKKTIPGSESAFSGKGITVGQALGLTSLGVNGYALAKNWGQIDTIQRLIYGTGTVAQGAQLAKSLGLLGAGTNGAAVPNVTPEALAKVGFTPAPSAGVGAVTGPANAVPSGYTAVASSPDGSVVAVPDGLQGTSSVSGVDMAAGGAQMAAGAYSVYKGWKQGGTAGTLQAIGGGAAMAAGLSIMTQTNPALFGGAMSASMLGGVAAGAGAAAASYQALNSNMSGEDKAKSVRMAGEDAVAAYSTVGLSSLAQAADQELLGGKGQKLREKIQSFDPMVRAQDYVAGKVLDKVGAGKNQEQVGRDQVRSSLVSSGFLNKDYTVELPDGTIANLGSDGRSEARSFKYADKAKSDATLRAYDVDYTNDMDYFSGVGGITLARLMGGEKATNLEQIGGQLGNAALGKVGYGAEMTQENFGSVMQNLRSLYAKQGISSKKDAYQLINQGYAEGRWNDTDLVSMQQTANMVFDDDYNTASKLSQGRWKGIDIIKNAETTKQLPKVDPNVKVPNTNQPMTKEEAIGRNAAKFPTNNQDARIVAAEESAGGMV